MKNNLPEQMWLDNQTGMMVIEKPVFPGGEYSVDNSEIAAAFWNQHQNARNGFLRDRENMHNVVTEKARATLTAWLATEPRAVRKAAITPVLVNTQNYDVQLWEPCEKCGTEPSYQTASGHFCKSCK